MTHVYALTGEDPVPCLRCRVLTPRLQLQAGLATPCRAAPVLLEPEKTRTPTRQFKPARAASATVAKKAVDGNR